MSPTIRRARLAGLLMLGITIVSLALASAATLATAAEPATSAAQATRNTPLGLSNATLVSHAEPDRRLAVVLTLDLRDHAGADALIAAQQDPDSELYHQWIEPEEFQARFGPLPSDIQAVKDFLGAQGFEKIDMPTSTMVAAEGTVALVEQAFGVQINLYSFDGRTAFSNDRDPVLPSYLDSKVLHVGGLDDLTVMRPQHGPVTEVPPGYAALSQNFILPRDNQVAYGQKAGYFDVGKKGTSGAELAVASSWDMQLSDVNDQLTRQGGAAAGYNLLTAAASGPHTISSTCIPNTGSGTGCAYVNNGGLNDSVETNWDVSLASSIANDNHIGVYLSQTPTTTAFATMYQYIADRAGTIKVVTHSWGVCLSILPTGDVQASENAFAQAAAGGQAWFVATGDHGSDGCHGNGGANPDVSYPAASPYVTAVGGSEQNTTAAGSFGADGWLVGYPANGEAACSEAAAAK